MSRIHFAEARLLTGVAIALFVAASAPKVFAQDGYKVGEAGSSPAPSAPAAPSPQTGTRMARIEFVSGSVTWRPDTTSDWKPARVLTALQPGAQIWATGSGKAELRFDDGAVVRIGQGATATVETLFSDAKGGFTRISVDNGSATLNARAGRGVYQLDLPLYAVAASGPVRLSIRTDRESRVIVRSGKAVVQSDKGKVQLSAGDTLSLASPDAAFVVRTAPASDSWDRWNDDRDSLLPRITSPAGAVIIPTIIFGGGYGHHHRDGEGYRRHW